MKAADMTEAYTEEGILTNSGPFNGLNNKKAIEKIADYLEEKSIGRRVVNYRLRDWLISRQRYWGAPIPMVYCDQCEHRSGAGRSASGIAPHGCGI